MDKDMNRFADKNKICVFIRTAIANRHFMVAVNIVGIHRNSCHCTYRATVFSLISSCMGSFPPFGVIYGAAVRYAPAAR